MRLSADGGERAWIRWLRRTLIFLLGTAACGVLGVLGAGEMLSEPALRDVGEAPADLGARSVRIDVPGGGTVAAWSIHATAGRGAVLLVHGVRADRREMTSRARWLKDAGYSLLMIDLPSHGESSGERITFGIDEAFGVKAALSFMRSEFPGERIGAIGVSLGAASLVLARPDPAPDAVVLESMYPTIDDAVADRLALHLGEGSRSLAPLLLLQLPLRLGIRPEQIRPIDALASLKAPVLVASGGSDRHTRRAEAERIFAAAGEPKQLWIVEGAAHQDLYAFDRDAYEAKVGGFLARYLRASP
jgi:alpha-beta hydrolase superfamily lysophospholipase